MTLSDKERKLLALALDPSAANGEVQVASVKLVESWRARDLQVTDFEVPLTNAKAAAIRPPRQWKPDPGLNTMPWGKHRGECFKDIPPGYLNYQLKWIRGEPDRATKFAELATQIETFLTPK